MLYICFLPFNQSRSMKPNAPAWRPRCIPPPPGRPRSGEPSSALPVLCLHVVVQRVRQPVAKYWGCSSDACGHLTGLVGWQGRQLNGLFAALHPRISLSGAIPLFGSLPLPAAMICYRVSSGTAIATLGRPPFSLLEVLRNPGTRAYCQRKSCVRHRRLAVSPAALMIAARAWGTQCGAAALMDVRAAGGGRAGDGLQPGVGAGARPCGRRPRPHPRPQVLRGAGVTAWREPLQSDWPHALGHAAPCWP